jgi:hypothetical protein
LEKGEKPMTISESHSMNADALTKVVFRLEESDWHSHSTETLWASPAGANRFRLENIPFYVYGVSYHDVGTVIEGGLHLYQDVVQRGGHSTYRIFLPEEISEEKFDEYWNPLRILGCWYERGTDYLIAVDVPPEAVYTKHTKPWKEE